jgi:CRISPR-associated exonuclease Cas4
LFYGAKHQRHVVGFDAGLRAETAQLAAAIQSMLALGATPPAVFAPKCRACSLIDLCKPQAVARSASAHLASIIAAAN